MRSLAATLVPFLLVATSCSSIDYNVATYGIVGPQFGDSDPFAFEGRKPGHYPVHGIDVSKWQGDIDWDEARRSGVSFAFIKATEGDDHLDELFHENWQEARAAGIPRGAYHFYYFCSPPEKQAYWFIRNVPRERGALPPVLDMEWNHQSETCDRQPDPATVRREMATFLEIVERHYGTKALVYTTVDFYQDNLAGYFADHAFWLRSVAGHPQEVYPEQPWVFWQYTGTGIVPGIDGDTDINVFAGSRDTWREWVAQAAQ